MHNFIELNSFVKIINLATTGGRAKLLIRSGVIKVNGIIETRNAKKLLPTDIVEYQNKTYLVGQYAKF